MLMAFYFSVLRLGRDDFDKLLLRIAHRYARPKPGVLGIA